MKILISNIVLICILAGCTNDSENAIKANNENSIQNELVESYKQVNANKDSYMHNYKYACLLSKAHLTDSSFVFLNNAIAIDTNLDALCDPDFIHLRASDKWNDFENKLISNYQIKFNNKIKNVDYAKALWRMSALDQAYYEEINISDKIVGQNSKVSIALWDLKQRINVVNQQELVQLIEQKGWPKQSEVGAEAGSSAFLVIQHSNNEYQEKYLPVIKDLCLQKEAAWGDYALMYDRVQMHNHKPQKYGSQLIFNKQTQKHEVYTLEDASKVDEYRKEVNLGPFKKLFNIL